MFVIESLTGMDDSESCGYCCFNQVVHEYGVFHFDGQAYSPPHVKSWFYPLYDTPSDGYRDRNGNFIETLVFVDCVICRNDDISTNSILYDDFSQGKGEDVVERTLKMTNLPTLQDPRLVCGFYSHLLQSPFFQNKDLILLFTPPWGDYEKEVEALRRQLQLNHMIAVPYIYQFVPFPLYPSECDATRIPLVFEVVGDSFTIHSFHPDDPLHPIYKHSLSLSQDEFITLLYNAVDKQAAACSLPPLSNQSDADLKLQLSLLFADWDEKSPRIITWHTPSGTRSVPFSSDIVWETKQRLFFDQMDGAFADLHITSFSPFLVVGTGDLAHFIRMAFQRYTHSPKLLNRDTHDILTSNLPNLVFAYMHRIDPSSFQKLLPSFHSSLSSAVHRSPCSLGWGECVAAGGETVLQSEEKGHCVELCLRRRDEDGPCVTLTVNRCRQEAFAPRDSCYVEGVVPHYFATNGDLTKEVESRASVGVLKDGQLSGPCLVEYGEKGLVFAGELVGGLRCGYGEVTRHGQRVFTGEFEKDRIVGRGVCVKPDGTEFIGSFMDGELHGVGCEVVCGEEVDSGVFVHGEWEGTHTVVLPKGVSTGVVSEERWNGPVVRSLADGGVLLSHYEEGVLAKEALWCEATGAVVDAYLTGEQCVQVRYGPEGKKVAIADCVSKPHSVAETDDLWLLGDGEAAGAEEAEVDAGAAALLALLEAVGGGEAEEDAWVAKVEAGLARGEEFGVREGEAVGRVVCEAEETEEGYSVRRGVRFENGEMGRIVWEKGGEKGCGEGKLVTEGGEVVYEGAFEDYLFCGNGSQFYRNGQVEYEGSFSQNVLNGKGRWYFPNGCLHYDGMWKDGLMEGNGMLYKPVNLEYANAALRLFLRKKGGSSPFISVAKDYDIYNVE